MTSLRVYCLIELIFIYNNIDKNYFELNYKIFFLDTQIRSLVTWMLDELTLNKKKDITGRGKI